MSFFDFLRRTDIHGGVEAFRAAPGAVLLDVRTREEYQNGHIPGSRNLPLDRIEAAAELVPQKDTPIYVYCLSGGRSRQGTRRLERMGYTNVTNIGGISGYRGDLER